MVKSCEAIAKHASPLLLTFGHWPGVTPYTSSFELAGSYVFDKQSLGLFSCGPDRISDFGCQISDYYLFSIQKSEIRRPISDPGRPYLKITAAVLPSSLTKVLSYTLGFSPYLPVSVCGTVTIILILEVFLDNSSA